MTCHAFVQRLGCGEHVFLRAGPLAKQYGDPWVWGCLGEVKGNAVTLIGYDDKSQPTPALDALKAMVRAVLEDGFEELNFDRLGDFPRHVVFSKGDEEGKITMSTMPKAADANLHPGAKATHGGHPSPHGVDVAVAKAGAAAAIKLFEDGAYACLSLSETPEDANGESLFIVRRKRIK